MVPRSREGEGEVRERVADGMERSRRENLKYVVLTPQINRFFSHLASHGNPAE